ncbi:MAG: hypothetical protein PHC53_01745 [Patescibacteria group bacterium]|nr:hypothetical protein [Patescibacteria group bacterium]
MRLLVLKLQNAMLDLTLAFFVVFQLDFEVFRDGNAKQRSKVLVHVFVCQ